VSNELTGSPSAPLALCQCSEGLATKRDRQLVVTAPLASCQWTAGLTTCVECRSTAAAVVKPAFRRHEAGGDEQAGWPRYSFQTSIPPA